MGLDETNYICCDLAMFVGSSPPSGWRMSIWPVLFQ
jgi:hypothetical protein